MQAHANDLRVEVAKDWEQLVEAAGRAGGDAAHDEFVHAVVDDWRTVGLAPKLCVLIEYIEKLTRRPSEMGEGDIERLRGAGWTDRAIHDAVQIASYFNYINRVADALGVEVEKGFPHWGCEGTSRLKP